jgi:hypothetical protein
MLSRHLYRNWDTSTALEDYRPILDHFADLYNQKALVSSEALAGFCFAAYQPDVNIIGVLEFAFGCCPGCDALSACLSYEAVDRLIEQMKRAIVWLPHERLMSGMMRVRERLLLDEQVKLFNELCGQLWD